MVRFAAFAAFLTMSCLAWGLPASAQASSSPPAFVNFTPGAPLPSIESESVSHITSTDATLEAQINPEGHSVRYQLQVVSNPDEYRSEIVCPPHPGPPFVCIGEQVAEALPIGSIPGNTLQPGVDYSASLDLASAGMTLQPGTTYQYRVIAARSVQTEDTIAWEGPPVYGPDQTFTTPPAGKAPVIESVSISHLTSSDARLEAKINTEGLETTYNFYLQEAPLCFKAIPPCERPQYEPVSLPSGKLLGSFVGQNVSTNLNSAGVSLSPGEHYEYWVTATSVAGTITGPAQEFTTPEDAVQPLSTTTSPPAGAGQPAGPSGGDQPAWSGGASPSSTPGVKSLGPTVGKTTKLKSPTKAEQLAKALKACSKQPRDKRATCAKRAHKRYAPPAKKSNK
jgi:hypothetical protein